MHHHNRGRHSKKPVSISSTAHLFRGDRKWRTTQSHQRFPASIQGTNLRPRSENRSEIGLLYWFPANLRKYVYFVHDDQRNPSRDPATPTYLLAARHVR